MLLEIEEACIGVRNTVLPYFALVICVLAVIGYVSYCVGIYKQITGKSTFDPEDGIWNWSIIAKLCIEDALSLILNTFVMFVIFDSHGSVMMAVSLLVSILTFMAMCIQHAVCRPCRNRKRCDECGAVMCCVQWVGVVALSMFMLVMGSRNGKF